MPTEQESAFPSEHLPRRALSTRCASRAFATVEHAATLHPALCPTPIAVQARVSATMALLGQTALSARQITLGPRVRLALGTRAAATDHAAIPQHLTEVMCASVTEVTRATSARSSRRGRHVRRTRTASMRASPSAARRRPKVALLMEPVTMPAIVRVTVGILGFGATLALTATTILRGRAGQTRGVCRRSHTMDFRPGRLLFVPSTTMFLLAP